MGILLNLFSFLYILWRGVNLYFFELWFFRRLNLLFGGLLGGKGSGLDPGCEIGAIDLLFGFLRSGIGGLRYLSAVVQTSLDMLNLIQFQALLLSITFLTEIAQITFFIVLFLANNLGPIDSSIFLDILLMRQEGRFGSFMALEQGLLCQKLLKAVLVVIHPYY